MSRVVERIEDAAGFEKLGGSGTNSWQPAIRAVSS